MNICTKQVFEANSIEKNDFFGGIFILFGAEKSLLFLCVYFSVF